jgi:hypothetical protein
MVHLAVPIKGLMRMMTDRWDSLIYFLSWDSGGCGVYSQNFGCNWSEGIEVCGLESALDATGVQL